MAAAGILRLLETSTVMNCPFPQRAITKNFSVRLVSSCRAQLRPHSLPLSSISRRQLYIDRAISRASLLRYGIQELISDAMRGMFAVLAEPMNRVSRNQEDIAMLPSLFRPLKTRSLSSRLVSRS